MLLSPPFLTLDPKHQGRQRKYLIRRIRIIFTEKPIRQVPVPWYGLAPFCAYQ